MRRRRWAIAISVAVAAAVAIAGWLAVSAIGTAHESARLKALISPPQITFDQIDEQLDEARRTLGRIKAYSTPFRLAPWIWGLMPVRGGDLRELPHLIDYSDSTLGAVASLYDLADGAREAIADDPRGAVAGVGRGAIAGDRRSDEPLVDMSTIRAAVRYVDQHRAALIAAQTQLRDAGSLASTVDRQRLSSGVGDAFDRVESVRGAVEVVVDVAAELAPAAADVDRILSVATVPPTATPAEGPTADLEAIARLAGSFPELAVKLRGAGTTLAPYAGRDPQAVEATLDYSIRLAAPVADLLRATADAGEIAGGGLPDDVESADRLERVLLRIEAGASDARAVANAVDRPGFASALLDTLSQQLRRLELSAVVSRELLGYNGRRHILVLGQDDEELRPAGGFIGTVWDLEFDHGRLVGSNVQSSYAIDEKVPLVQWMQAPPGFAMSFDADVIPFRDQNWWPDFTFSAARLRETYERGQGIRPHAVVALNQRSLEAILSAIGPIEIQVDRSVDAEGLREFLRQGIEPAPGTGTPPDIDPRRFASQLLGAAMIRRISEGASHGESLDLFRLSLDLNRVTSDGDLLIDVEARAARSALRELGWDGALAAYSGDGWYWVDSNAYSPKISQQIVRTMRQRVEIQPDGSSVNTLTVGYENPLRNEDPTDGAPGCVQPAHAATPPCYWIYVRLYLPARAELLSTPGFETPAGAVGSDRLLQSAAPSSPGAAPTTLRAARLGVHLEVSALAVVLQGAKAEWEFVYRVPDSARRLATGEWRYSSRIERQPGTPPMMVMFEIAAPPGACVTNVDGVLQSGTATASGSLSASRSLLLTRDLDLGVTYSFDPTRCR